jgi:hypothetical protein
VDVILPDAGDFGMHQKAAFLFPDVNFHGRGLRLGAEIDWADEETAEQVVKWIASDQAVHLSLLSFSM